MFSLANLVESETYSLANLVESETYCVQDFCVSLGFIFPSPRSLLFSEFVTFGTTNQTRLSGGYLA